MAATGTDVSDLRKLTVVKLRAKLSDLGLATGGLKADLVERLHKYYQEEAASGEDEEAAEGLDEEDGVPMEDSGQFSPPPPRMMSPQRSAPSSLRSARSPPGSAPPTQRSAPPPKQPPPLMSIPTQEPASQRKQATPTPSPGPTHITRTTLQMRLQQLADGHSDETQGQQTPQKEQQLQPPASQPQSQTPSPKPPSQHTPEPKMSSPPPPRPTPPPPRPLLPPPPRMTPPPGIQHRPPIPPPRMTSPPSLTSGKPPPLGPMGQPPSMSQPPPPGQISPSQPLPPGQFNPPHSLGKPPQLPPPPGVGPPPVQLGQVRPPPGIAPPQVSQSQQIPPPPGVGPPTSQIGQPPPQMMPPIQRNQDSEFREKVNMQNRLLEQERQQQQEKQRQLERQQQQEKQRQLEQQQKDRLAMQQQAMLLQQQQQQSGPPAPPGEEGPGDLMEKVRQQQIMLEQQKRKEQLEQQQKAMLEQQNQAIKKQEEERKRKEVELVRQQIAIMEAQRDEQSKRLRDETRGPPPVTTSSGGSQPFNPAPSMLQHSTRPPMMPPHPTGSRPPGIPPPHSAPGPMPPRMPGGGDQVRGPRPSSEDRGQQEGKDFKLPLALAKTLAYRAVRALEVGTTLEEWERENMPQRKKEEEGDDEIEMVEMEEEDEADEEPQAVEMDTSKKSKSKAKKKKKKKSKRKRQQQTIEQPLPEKSTEPSVEIEYVPEALDLDPMDPNYFTFNRIFEAFKIEEPKEAPKVVEVVPEKPAAPVKVRNPDDDDSDSDNDEDDKNDDKGPKMSKKKLKKMTRMSVAELKMQVRRPDLVEMHDVNAKDPILLLELKSTRNTVPVPAHWCFKRKYLQGKRGIEKAPFQLPEFIEATGITEMREAQAEKEDAKSLKGKMREKVRPKMGKIDIDYQKLHDAFFKYQVKPKLTIHGDLYYEGKEFETRLREKKPGNLSDDLKTALGMPIGFGSEKMPPPWLIAMQRYGPPPSYPNLKIPGLNAPIPEGCSFGYHAGGWGKPPVNENGKPLYGDVFGTNSGDFETADAEEEVDKSHWGEMESESEEEEEPESEEEEEAADETGLITPAEGLVTPSGITSIPVGMETPDMIELRKRRIEDAMDQGGETPALYQVIPEKKTTVGGAMMGSAHIYDVGALPGGPKKPGDKVAAEGIEVALNPEELDLDTAAMQAKYDQTLREQQSQLEKEDLSDMVAEHAAKQKKRKKKQEDSGKAAKKYKEFKF